MYKISGRIVDIINRDIFEGSIVVENGIIYSVNHEKNDNPQYILPGLIDSHIHIESSMLIPSEFARLAVVHGTVATVSDPHEIANVMGIKGVNYMVQNGKKVPFKFFFGAPSCVPATPFETAGAEIGLEELEKLLKSDNIKYMSEMMNWPGVIYDDELVKAKLDIAKKYNKPIDGHAPGLNAEQAKKYIAAGISTDHECFGMQEALDKIKYGMKVLIREGSAAKNFTDLAPLIARYPEDIMFCSDDKHPNDLVEGHMNELVKRALQLGYDPMTVLRICILNPVKHYGLDVGLLRKGDPADFIVVDELTSFNVQSTYINGLKVAENGNSLIQPVHEKPINKFEVGNISTGDIRIPADNRLVKVINALEGQLITTVSIDTPVLKDNALVSDTSKDVLKIVVLNRYTKSMPGVAFIKNIGLKRGAIASSVAHDSHNIVAVGVSDEEIVKAINLIVKEKGGVSLVDGEAEHILPLPVAGIMSNHDAHAVARTYDFLDQQAKELGSKLNAPYMTLSFMALLVIPELKLSDKGLFDGNKFEFTSLYAN